MATSATLPAHSPPGARSFLKRLTSGDEIARLITTLFASFILLLTLGMVWELWIHSSLARAEVRFRLSDFDLLGSGNRPVRRAPLHLRHGDYVGAGLADRRASGRRRSHFSRGARPAAYFKLVYFLHRAAGGRTQRDLRLAGNFHAGAADARFDRAFSESPLGIPADLQRPDIRCRISDSGGDPGDHDAAFYHFHLARFLAGSADRAARGGAGLGRHALGIHLARGGAVCARWGFSALFFWGWRGR